jgi:hypothetical protein
MKYQVELPNKLYKSEIKVEVAGSQLQATETTRTRKDSKRISSNGVEVDFASPAEARAAASKAQAHLLSLKQIARL